ncbi:16S rRNA (uracil(1498)-N(3))-methyltransferase [Rhodoflexus caldus]|uniref:16S rRNA (uracil(1498)-N(3))-methyltransferase n=1 Tax=Rhodoflexus caldus TaxID=2891236 RepID=UPI002029CA0D|nr:16S rRNA (uracil(1498)-N(3))-methyltransferase [Rhodoflexus caldus]
MQLFYAVQLPPVHQEFVLSEEESKHCVRVLRMMQGDAIHFTDGQGTLAEAMITDAHPKRCKVGIMKLTQQPKPYRGSIHLAVAPTKNAERMEWMVEKCTETGIDRISFVLTERTERAHFNTERMEKKALAAMKQSLQCWLPQICAPLPLADFLQKVSETGRFIAHADKEKPLHLFQLAQPATDVCLLIGPEGDFTPAELEAAKAAGFQVAGLGNTRLRTETAAILGCHALHLLNEVK